MSEESDGVSEEFEGHLRVLMTAASQGAEQIARARQESMRRAEAEGERSAREMQSRLDAERSAAVAEIKEGHRAEWWASATPEQVGRLYETAHAWSGEDAQARRIEERVQQEVMDRWGVDVRDAGGDPAAVRNLLHLELERAERARDMSHEERGRQREDEAEAHRLQNEAQEAERSGDEAEQTAHDPDAEIRAAAQAERAEAQEAAAASMEDSSYAYDSAERREAMAEDLRSRGIDSEVVASRMRADTSQARPATEATRGADQPRAPKAKRRSGRSTQIQRGGLSR